MNASYNHEILLSNSRALLAGALDKTIQFNGLLKCIVCWTRKTLCWSWLISRDFDENKLKNLWFCDLVRQIGLPFHAFAARNCSRMVRLRVLAATLRGNVSNMTASTMR